MDGVDEDVASRLTTPRLTTPRRHDATTDGVGAHRDGWIDGTSPRRLCIEYPIMVYIHKEMTSDDVTSIDARTFPGRSVGRTRERATVVGRRGGWRVVDEVDEVDGWMLTADRRHTETARMASLAMRASAFKPTVGGLRARCVASRVDGTDGTRPTDRLIHASSIDRCHHWEEERGRRDWTRARDA